jgi:hypothetical protein
MQHNRGHGPEEVRYAQVVELIVKDMGVKKGSSESLLWAISETQGLTAGKYCRKGHMVYQYWAIYFLDDH